jgi:transposase-like protein
MAKVKNNFNAEFKSKVATEALRENKTINEIASAHGVHPGQVTQWKKAILKKGSMIFERKSGKQKQKGTALEELQRVVGEQAIQLAWYKKKFGIAN